MNNQLRRRIALSLMLVTVLAPLLVWPSPAFSASAAAWTTVGSGGTVDEDSVGLVSMGTWVVGFAAAQTGTITIRYNITAVRGLTCSPVTANVVTVRFRDSDGTGNAARVMFTINSTDTSNGGNNILYTFDSNVGATATSAYQDNGTSFPTPFDFTTKAYWIEAKISRSNGSALANLGPIAIWATNNATPCPE